LVSRPECSWVAGRTGFGPVHTGEIMGSTDLGDISMREETIHARVVSVHNKIDPIVDSGDEATLGGEEKSVHVCSMETTGALEVYCRRDTPSKRNSKLRNRDSGDSTEGDLAESSLQGGFMCRRWVSQVLITLLLSALWRNLWRLAMFLVFLGMIRKGGKRST
jgi:hypothetical protein